MDIDGYPKLRTLIFSTLLIISGLFYWMFNDINNTILARNKANNEYWNNRSNWTAVYIKCPYEMGFNALKIKERWNFTSVENTKNIFVPDTCIVIEK